MKIQIVGAGTVGTATGKGFLRFGHDVTFYDIDAKKRKLLKNEGYKVKVRMTDVVDADVTFICTPEESVEDVVKCIVDRLWKEWMKGLSFRQEKLSLTKVPLQEFADSFDKWIDQAKPLIVIRSTVLPGTTEELHRKFAQVSRQGISQKSNLHICHNPEFLREAVADYEFMNPHKIVIGECCRVHGDLLEELYRPFNVPIVRVNPRTSELIKLASNVYLATQISFWNQVKLIADKLGVNSHVVGKVCALDPRISRYGASLHGKAYGGRCLPKDLAQLNTVARKLGVTTVLLEAVKEINNHIKAVGGGG